MSAAPCQSYPGSASWLEYCHSRTSGQTVPCNTLSTGQLAIGLYDRYRLGPNGEMCIGQGTFIADNGITVDYVSGSIEDVTTTITDNWTYYLTLAVVSTILIVGIWLLGREIMKL